MRGLSPVEMAVAIRQQAKNKALDAYDKRKQREARSASNRANGTGTNFPATVAWRSTKATHSVAGRGANGTDKR